MTKFEKFAWNLWRNLSMEYSGGTNGLRNQDMDGTYILVVQPGSEPFAIRREEGEWTVTPSLPVLDNMSEVVNVASRVESAFSELRPCSVPGCQIGISYGYFCNPHLDALPFDLRKRLRQQIKEHGSLRAEDIKNAAEAIVGQANDRVSFITRSVDSVD